MADREKVTIKINELGNNTKTVYNVAVNCFIQYNNINPNF